MGVYSCGYASTCVWARGRQRRPWQAWTGCSPHLGPWSYVCSCPLPPRLPCLCVPRTASLGRGSSSWASTPCCFECCDWFPGPFLNQTAGIVGPSPYLAPALSSGSPGPSPLAGSLGSTPGGISVQRPGIMSDSACISPLPD